MNSLAKAQPMKPQQGKVSTQAHTMRRATPQFTRRKLFDAPTPMMEAVEQWEVETGMPVIEATNSVITVEMEAATPWYFSSETISMATDLMMRLPPSSVPRDIAAEQMIMSLMPAGIILYLQLASPGFLDMLYGNPFGIGAMSVCLAVYGTAYWMGKRIVEIEV